MISLFNNLKSIKNKSKFVRNANMLLLLLLFSFFSANAAVITSTATGGTWSTGSTWVGGVVPLTTDSVIITTGATVTLTAARTVSSVTINTGASLLIGNINALTVTGNFVNNGTFRGTTGRLIVNGLTSSFTNSGTFTMGAGRIYFYGNIVGFGTHTLTGTQVRFYGTANQSIAAFTTSGLISMLKTGGTATCIANINGSKGLTINGNGGTLNLGVGLTHTFSKVTLTNGTLNGGSCLININSVSTSAWGGTGSRFTAGTSTVNFNVAGAQRLSATVTTFNNLTFSNSGLKTLTTANCIVNGIVSMEGTATVSATPTYGAIAKLQYNTATSRNAGLEWITPFTGSGGVTILNTGVISMNAAKVLNASVPLTINSGASLSTVNFQLTFGGNFVNSGTFTAGSSPIVIANTMATQSIAGFTTTGLVSMTKTGGTATFGGNVSGGGLTINGSGGILNLGTALTHTFSGVVTLTSGNLNGGSSILNENSVSATAWNGTGSLFTAGTGTVNFGAAGNQTLSATATTFNNLTFSNFGIKTLTTANCTVTNTISMEGTATVSATPTYGAISKLQYNTTSPRTAGVEWITPFAATGGVTSINTGIITMNAAKVFNTSVPLTIGSGATIATGNFQLNFGGNFVNNGTLTAGSSPIVIDNTMSSQSIAGITTTGLVSMTKTSGTASFTGNISGSGLTINGTGGTLNLGTSLIHAFTANLTRTAGTLNLGSSSLRIAGAISGTGGTFTAATGTIEYNGAAQSIVVLPYYALSLSGSGTKTFAGTISTTNIISIATGVVANLAGFTNSAIGLSLGGILRPTGSWGGTGSGATNINTTFFTANTGSINNNCSVPTITGQPTSPAATCSGIGTLSMTVTATGSGLSYSWRKSGVPVVNGGVISGQGTATLTLTAPAVLDAGSYDVVVTDTCPISIISSSVTVTVNASPVFSAQPTATTVCQNLSSSFSVAATAISPTYQWQYSTNPVTSWTNTNALLGVSGSTTNMLSWVSTPITYTNFNFRCVVTSSNGCASNSNPALLLVNPTPTVGAVSLNQAICSGSEIANDITIASATGTIQWQKADNAGFTIGLTNLGTNSTTLTIAQVGTLTTTTYFRAIVSSGVCAPVTSGTIEVTIASTTWTSAGGGSWNNGTPTSAKAAIISYNYNSSGDINACTLTIDSGAVVSITAGDNVTLNGALTVTSGSFTLENNANLIQQTDIANSGNIIVKRNSASLMRQDYTLWSSPVEAQQLQSFSPGTLSTRFYTYNPSSDIYVAVSSPATTNFTIGTGYLIRMPNNHPVTPIVWNGSFSGVPNNGPENLGVSINTYNAIGNPYPSTIDADTFISDNAIVEALYFWRKTNNSATTSYATYTTLGGVSNSGGDPLLLVPNGVIQVGQGFIAKSTSTSLNFTNSMRIADNSDQFLREVDYKNRFWLNLTNTSGFFGQTLIGYMDNATSDVDPAIDGRFFNDSQTALTSIINNEEFSIQGRALPFDANDIVPLGFKSELAGNYTITLDHFDALFEDTDLPIFLKDNLTNTSQNLRDSVYSFATEAGVFNTRFEIVYTNPLIVNQNPFDENDVVIYKQNQDLVINSGSINMKSVKIFDLQGRLILDKKDINAMETKINLLSKNQVLLVLIISEEFGTVTKKIVH
jgi:hypothetical protein